MVKRKAEPGKEEEKQTESQVEDMILKYMKQVNRPYSANDIQMNLRITLSKAKVAKVLTKLTDDGHLLRKQYNKSMIYCILQDLTIKASPEELEILEDSINQLTEVQNNILIENNKLDKELNKLKYMPKIDELKSRINAFQVDNQNFQKKLKTLSEEKISISAEERNQVNNEYELIKESWRKKYKKYKDIFLTISENYPGDPKILKEQIGIDDPTSFEELFASIENN